MEFLRRTCLHRIGVMACDQFILAPQINDRTALASQWRDDVMEFGDFRYREEAGTAMLIGEDRAMASGLGQRLGDLPRISLLKVRVSRTARQASVLPQIRRCFGVRGTECQSDVIRR
jgi:hypothetical protein